MPHLAEGVNRETSAHFAHACPILASKACRTTKSSLARECLEKQLPDHISPANLPILPPGKSVYDHALPILKRAWARNRKLPRDLATKPKYMKGFGE
ncbi:MAG: hypothetical protein WCL11_05865 [Verrucomicrobiota bacterium]